jgi:Bacterial PH domain/Short C-terminal domain
VQALPLPACGIAWTTSRRSTSRSTDQDRGAFDPRATPGAESLAARFDGILSSDIASGYGRMDKHIEKLMRDARPHLGAGETPIAVVFGLYRTRTLGASGMREGLFIATEKRIVFFAKKLFGYVLESFPYANVSSLELSKGLTGHTLSFFASGNRMKMEWINRGDLDRFLAHVRNNIGNRTAQAPASLPAAAPAPVATPTVDFADQIRKLGALRDAGLLTEEEFTAKKREILARV